MAIFAATLVAWKLLVVVQAIWLASIAAGTAIGANIGSKRLAPKGQLLALQTTPFGMLVVLISSAIYLLFSPPTLPRLTLDTTPDTILKAGRAVPLMIPFPYFRTRSLIAEREEKIIYVPEEEKVDGAVPLELELAFGNFQRTFPLCDRNEENDDEVDLAAVLTEMRTASNLEDCVPELIQRMTIEVEVEGSCTRPRKGSDQQFLAVSVSVTGSNFSSASGDVKALRAVANKAVQCIANLKNIWGSYLGLKKISFQVGDVKTITAEERITREAEFLERIAPGAGKAPRIPDPNPIAPP